MTGVAFLAVLFAYALTLGLRVAAALRLLRRREPPATGDASTVTVLQPILSGDPALEGCLSANLANTPEARFLWLTDSDDPEAQRIAAALGRESLSTLVCAPPRQGENPKAAKLAAALALVETPLFAVLDDDTILPPGALARAVAALEGGDLATGLPVYDPPPGFWSGLVGAFVNGAAAITYPAAATLGQQRTINGMFYLGRTEQLRALGGFETIRGALTDDYAMATLYLRSGGRIVQTAIAHPIRTSVRGPWHYGALMRRWMIFALRYVRENGSAFTLGLIGISTLAPPALLVLGAAAGPSFLALGVAALFTKALGLAAIRARYLGRATRASEAALEALADVLTPLHLAAALALSNRFQWRSRTVRMDGDRIGYV